MPYSAFAAPKDAGVIVSTVSTCLSYKIAALLDQLSTDNIRKLNIYARAYITLCF